MDEFEPFGYEEEYAEEGGRLSAVKSLLPKIIAIIIIAVIGFFVYDFFFGGFVEVNISVKDTEGKAVQAKIEVTPSTGGEAVFKSKTLTSNASTKLKAGDYRVEVRREDYITYSKHKTITGEEGEEGAFWEITLEKDFAKDVELVKLQGPSEIFAGQAIQGNAVLRNNGSEFVEMELLAKSPSKDLGIEFSLLRIALTAGKEQPVSFTITTAEAIQTGKTGKDYKIEVRIKGTNRSKTKKTITVKAFPAPKLEVTPKDIKLKADAGKERKKEIRIRNAGKVSARDLKARIEITSAPVNTLEEAKKWFFFVGTARKSEIEIDSIGTGFGQNEAAVTLKVKVPETAKKETISGQLIISADWLSEEIKKTIELEIGKEVKVGVTVRLPASEIKVPYSGETGEYEKVTSKYITIKNEGEVALGINATGSPINIQVKNSEDCTEEWISKFEPSSIDNLLKGDERKVWLEVSAPIEAFAGETQYVVCEIMVTYKNPLTQQQDIPIERSMKITAEQS